MKSDEFKIYFAIALAAVFVGVYLYSYLKEKRHSRKCWEQALQHGPVKIEPIDWANMVVVE